MSRVGWKRREDRGLAHTGVVATAILELKDNSITGELPTDIGELALLGTCLYGLSCQ